MIRCPVVLLVPVCLLLAQTPSALATFQVSGTVVDAVTNAALTGAEVQVSPVGKPQLIETAVTDSSGRFTFSNVFAGKYSLSAAHAGYRQQTFQEHAGYSTAIAVGPDLISKDIVFPLSRPAILSGLITDQDNEPISGSTIYILHEKVIDGLKAVTLPTFNTDSEGRYSAALDPGTYYIAVSAQPWYAQQYMAMNQRGPMEAEGSSKLDVAYPVTYYPGVTSDESASPIKLTAGAHVEANLSLTAVPAAHVTFERVNNANTNARLLAVNHWGSQIWAPSMYFSQTGQVFSVAPGRYRALAGWRDGTGQHSVQRTIDVGGSVTIDLKSAEEERAVTASVTDGVAAGQLHPGMLGLRDLNTLQVWRPLPQKQREFRWPAQQLTSSRYEVVFSSNENVYLDRVSATNAKVTGRTVEFAPTGPVQLKVTLALGKAAVRGKVEQDGKPVAAAMVLLLRDDFASSPSLIRRDQSDSDGTFSLANVVPGHYTLLALPTDENLEYARAETMQPYLPNGKALDVAPGKQYEETIALLSSVSSSRP